MSGARQTKAPAKLQDCFVGDDIDRAINNAVENPTDHEQCDGKTNNVSFSTDAIGLWKKAILTHFPDKAEVIKADDIVTVVKVPADQTVKINLYETGSVVIQGAKCKDFRAKNFEKLKQTVDNFRTPSESQNIDDEITDPKSTFSNADPLSVTQVGQETRKNDECDKDLTSPKSLDVDSEPDTLNTTVVENITPIVHSNIVTPNAKDRVTMHQATLATKLGNINTVLDTVNNALVSMVDLVSDVKRVVDNISPSIGEKIKSTSSKVKEQLDSIESKIKHNNQLTESLHLKSNTMDNQIKKMCGEQEFICKRLEKLELIVTAQTEEKYERDDHKSLEMLEQIMTEQQFEHKEITSKLKEQLDSIQQITATKHEESQSSGNGIQKSAVNPEENKTSQGETKKNETRPANNCDNLILADSILQRINARRFSPREKTVKKYIRGGAQTCTRFVSKFGPQLNPKRTIVNVGTRDLQNDDVHCEDFDNLFTQITATWPDTTVYVLPIIPRKDIIGDRVVHANEKIITASKRHTKVKMLDCFKPSDDMFDDDVHLNTSLGIPELVKHLKRAMDIPSARHNESPRHNRHNESGEKIDKTPGTNNIAVQPVDFNNNMPVTQQIYSPNHVQAHQPFVQHTPQPILPQHPMFTPGPPTPLPYFNPWLWGPFNHPQNLSYGH